MNEFSKTTAGQIADAHAMKTIGIPIDNCDDHDKIEVLEAAADDGVFIDTLIAILPLQLRMAASEIRDRTCTL